MLMMMTMMLCDILGGGMSGGAALTLGGGGRKGGGGMFGGSGPGGKNVGILAVVASASDCSAITCATKNKDTAEVEDGNTHTSHTCSSPAACFASMHLDIVAI